jgi:putative aldouronate transport system substrate-binding protein
MKKLIVPCLLAGLASIGPVTGVKAKEATWITNQPLTLTIHMHFRDKFVWEDSWPAAKELSRLTNVTLHNTASKAATNSLEQFNLTVASGMLPDIVAGDNLKDNFIRYGMEGAFIPLNKLIDQYAPNLKAFFKTHPFVKNAITAPDGNIYFIPYVPDGKVARTWWIREDWLDKLHLKQPTTVDELYTVLKAFRDKDPNGNGKKDEIPFFTRENQMVYALVNLWGARSTGSDSACDFYAEGGKMKHPFAEEKFRVGIKNMAKWYAEKLIDPEVFTRGGRAREQLYGANNGGFTYDWPASTASYNTTFVKTIPGFKVVGIKPVKDSTGKLWVENSRLQLRPDGWAITSRNKHAIETIKLFDFYFSPKGRLLSNFGVEGKTYSMKNGKPVFSDEVLKGKTPVLTQMWSVGAQIPIGFWQDYEYERQWTIPTAQSCVDVYTKGNWFVQPFYGVNMTKSEREVYDKYWPDIKTYMLEMAQSWVLGTKNVDKTWDEYQKHLKAMGFEKVLAVLQTAYARQYK